MIRLISLRMNLKIRITIIIINLRIIKLIKIRKDL